MEEKGENERVSRLPIWSSAEEISAFALPSFSAYPQSYVTSVGEYLLTLPQQLEPLVEGISSDDANADDAQFFATEWMFKVAEGASAIYMEQLRGIQHITDRGAQQLSLHTLFAFEFSIVLWILSKVIVLAE